MSTYDAGDAGINIRPTLKDFKAELEADLKKIDAQLGVTVHPDLAQAQADLARWRAQEERNALDIPVNVDTNSVQRATRELGNLADAGKALSALKWNAGALGLGSLPAAATALTTVVASLQQISQVGLVLPGVMAAGAASIGTFKLGVAGVADAFDAVEKSADGSAKSIAAAQEALAGLAPSAADAVKTAAEVKTELDKALRKPVQQNLFEGVSGDLRKLVDADLPVLQKGLTGIASGLNQNLRQLMASAGSESSQGLLDRILGNTGDAQARLTKAIDPLVHALGTLTAAGSDTLPKLADGVGRLAERFDTFINKADQDGRLDKWIDGGIKGVEHLGSIVLDLGKSLAAVTNAAGGGEGLLSLLDAGAEKLATFLNSAEGQDKLTRFFNEGKQQLGQWLPILQNVAGMLPGVFAAAKQWTDVLLPPLQSITGFLAEHPGLIENVATAFIAWKTIDGITSLLGSLGTVKNMLGVDLPGAASTGAGGISAALARVAVPAWLAYLVGQQNPFIAPPTQNPDGSQTFPTFPGQSPDDKSGASIGPDGKIHITGKDGQPLPPGPLGLGAPNPPAPQVPKSPQPAGVGNGPHGKPPVPVTGGPTPSLGGIPIPPGVLPHYDAGGPTPSGKGPGPTGGWLSEIHSDEWVLPAHARKRVGDQALWALTAGRSFLPGGTVDEYGNPITPGAAPGPVASPGSAAPSIAPNPYQGGGLGGIFSSIASGIQGPLGNAMNLASGLSSLTGTAGADTGLQTQHGFGTILPGGSPAGSAAPLSMADRAAGIPGLWGLIGSAFSSDPASNLMAWGEQTGQWLGNFTARTVGSFATSLWQGALDLVGLGGSILSPNNPWNQAGQSIGQFAFSSDGPLGKLLGANPGAGAAGADTQKQVSPKKIRDAQDKVADKQKAVDEQRARLAELPANASDATRMARQNALDKAIREASQAQADLTALFGGGSSSGGGASGLSGLSYPVGGTGAERWRPVVRQVLATYGPTYGITGSNFQAWEDALVRQINTESGGNPDSVNPTDSNGRGGTQRVAGILNFLQSTFEAHNITGGSYMDPASQIAAALPYVTKRWGIDENGAPLQIGRGQGFAFGGSVRGPGGPKGDQIPAWLSDNEHVLTSEDVDAMGGQDEVYAFRAGLHRAPGGEVSLAALRNPTPPPRPQVPDIKSITPKAPAPAAPTPAPQQPAPTPSPAGAAPAPAPTPAPPPPAAAAPAHGAGPGAAPAGSTAAPRSSGLDHNLPAINTAIDSTASTLGNLASTAMSIAGGGGGGAGVPGLGAAGPFVSGLIQQGGKIAKSGVNVFSSALVGNLGDNTTAGAYGAPVLSAPPQPAQPIDRSTHFGDVQVGDPRDFIDQYRLFEQQRTQTMADYVV